MNKRIYTADEIRLISANPNVTKCSSKAISYSKEFKVKAIKAYYEEGQSPNRIFLDAGFDLNVIGRNKPKDCLKEWRNIYKSKGRDGLLKENRGKSGGGGRKSKDFVSNNVEYLKTKIAYLEAENNFLKNLKTKRKT